ncbi:hypothetical protein [Streptomyces sp. NPDC054837]
MRVLVPEDPGCFPGIGQVLAGLVGGREYTALAGGVDDGGAAPFLAGPAPAFLLA